MSHTTQQTLARIALAALLLVPVGAVLASPAVNTGQGLTLTGPPLALRGYDPVAYFTDGKPVLGKAAHAVAHEGATYRFATRSHLEAFEAAPDRYLPQFGGFCAFGVAVNAKFDGDPRLWEIVDGKLYLNLNDDIQKKWLEDVDSNIAKAQKNWAGIRDRAPEALQ